MIFFPRDLYRVNFEVTNLKPFPYLAFPRFTIIENACKQPGFDGELMASFQSLSPVIACGVSAALCRICSTVTNASA